MGEVDVGLLLLPMPEPTWAWRTAKTAQAGHLILLGGMPTTAAT